MRGWSMMALMALGCGGADPDAVLPPGELSDCDPLDTALCALPFPSAHHLVEDESTATGLRVNFAERALPLNRDGVQMRPVYYNKRDGYSINSAMLAYFDDVSYDGLPTHLDIDASLASDSLSVLIDTVTGEALPHWVEPDSTAPSPEEQLLTLRAAIPFEWDRRYVVAFRNLRTTAGGEVPASPAFASLRDGTEGVNPDADARRAHFNRVIFPAIEALGWSRDELTLAWDFHTASRSNTLGDLLHMRDDALENAPAGGPPYELLTVDDRDCDEPGTHIGRHIEGRFTAPLYTEADRAATFLNRGEDGMPAANGTTEVPFIIRVPCSVIRGADGTGPTAKSAPVVQYGHGLLGGHGEVNTGYLGELADEFGWILFASSWTGFKTQDSPAIALMLAQDPTNFAFVSERSHQGMIEFVLALRMMIGDMATDEALTFDGAAVIDPERRYYYGNSQGGIMGTAYLGLSTDIHRGVLGVGGGPYSLLLPRSSDFDPFFLIFKQKYLDHRDIMIFVAGLSQQLWDATEPGGWMWDITRDVDPPKQALLQVAVGDVQVTTLGAHIQARAFGARIPAPATRSVWGVDEADAPFGGSALVEFEYGDAAVEPFEAVPPEGSDPHECPRRETAAQLQMRDFLEEGVVRHYCEGPCIRTTMQGVCR